MAIDRCSRRVFTSPLSAEDEAANRRVSAVLLSLPVAIERQIEGHFFMGAGLDGERRLREALEHLIGKEGGHP